MTMHPAPTASLAAELLRPVPPVAAVAASRIGDTLAHPAPAGAHRQATLAVLPVPPAPTAWLAAQQAAERTGHLHQAVLLACPASPWIPRAEGTARARAVQGVMAPRLVKTTALQAGSSSGALTALASRVRCFAQEARPV